MRHRATRSAACRPQRGSPTTRTRTRTTCRPMSTWRSSSHVAPRSGARATGASSATYGPPRPTS
eukprot:11053418-Lingulodinium_polyedra.AAC.1